MDSIQQFPLFRKQHIKALSLTLLLLPVASFSAFADYQLIDLGIDVTPTDINNQGTIVGSRKTDNGTIAFSYVIRRPVSGHSQHHRCKRR